MLTNGINAFTLLSTLKDTDWCTHFIPLAWLDQTIGFYTIREGVTTSPKKAVVFESRLAAEIWAEKVIPHEYKTLGFVGIAGVYNLLIFRNCEETW